MSEQRKVRFAPEIEMATFKSEQKSQIQVPDEKSNRDISSALEELVRCSLCMDRLINPKMLLCQHTFCLFCLQFHLSPGATEVLCPTCQKPTPLEKGLDSLEHLPGNHFDSILKLLAENSKSQISTTTAPETKCIKCQAFYEFSEKSSQQNKQQLCDTCWSNYLKELQEKLKLSQEQLKDAENQLNHRVSGFKDSFSQLEENIKATGQQKIKEIKQKEKECLVEAENIKESGIKSAKILEKQIEELQKNIKAKEFEKMSDNCEKFKYFMSMHKKAKSLIDEISNWGDTQTNFDPNSFEIDSEGVVSPDVEPGDDKGALCVLNPLENQDNLLKYYKTKRFTPKLTWKKCLRPAGVGIAPWNTNCIYIAGMDSRHVYGLDKIKGKLLFKISSEFMLCPVGITFSSSREEIYISDKWKHCIYVFDKNGDHLRTFGQKGNLLGQFTSPEGITLVKDELLFICDTGNDRIQILNAINGKFLYAFGITSQEIRFVDGEIVDFKYTELNAPTGIAVFEDQIIVADSGNRRIKTYTLDGKKLGEFGTLGKNKGQFKSPEVVAVDPLGFIIVGDSGNARIQIFTPNGTLVRVFKNKGKFSWISGVCITPELEIIITDNKNHTVQLF